MKKSIIVVDDFYKDPFAVREYALNQSFSKAEYETGYPGLETQSLAEKEMLFIANRLSEIIGKRLSWPPDRPQGIFRILTKAEEKTQTNIVHIDPCNWTGVIYLNLPNECEGGTSFYKHKESGTYSLFPELHPDVLKAKELYGIHDYNDVQQHIFKDTTDLTKWIETDRVSMRFNRLILFNGSRFHGVPHLFGTSKETGRFTQTFFFYEAENFDKDGNLQIPIY